ncbi:hypothetical protein G4928_09510, partial [Anaerostipes hadrus]
MKYIKLKDVCKINMGQSPDSSSYNESGEGIPFFQGNADFGDRYPVTRIWCSEPKKVAQENDILISVRAPIGAINYSKEKCCIGRGLAALTVDKTKISEKLLFWVLKAKKEELNRQGTGSTFKAISKKSLEELLIPQIDIKEQEKDVEILEKIYMIIQNKHKELKLLTDLISARFVEMFGTLDNPTQNFQTARLEELCSKITDGKHGGCVQEKGTKRYFVGAREIYDDKIHYDTAPEININEFEKDYKRCNVEIGDFLIVNTGATIGKSAIATDERTIHTLLQKSVALLKVRKELLNSVFLKWCYRVNTKMYMVESASAQANLLLSKIRKTKIYVPDINLQNKFASFVQQVNKSKF